MQSRIKHMRCTTPITGKLLDKFIFIFKYLCNILTLGLPHERRVNNILTGMIGMHIHLGDSKEITRSTAELHQEHLRWKTVLGTSTLRGWTWERPGWHIHPSTKDYPRKKDHIETCSFPGQPCLSAWPGTRKTLLVNTWEQDLICRKRWQWHNWLPTVVITQPASENSRKSKTQLNMATRDRHPSPSVEIPPGNDDFPMIFPMVFPMKTILLVRGFPS